MKINYFITKWFVILCNESTGLERLLALNFEIKYIFLLKKKHTHTNNQKINFLTDAQTKCSGCQA